MKKKKNLNTYPKKQILYMNKNISFYIHPEEKLIFSNRKTFTAAA